MKYDPDITIKDQSISIIIPALYEQEKIKSLIDHIESIRGNHSIEIIVVDGDSEGSTIRHLIGKNVKVIVSKKGRAVQMNQGTKEAKGEVLLFLHADTYLPETAFDEIEKTMSTGEYVGGSFDLGIDNPGWSFRLIELMAALRYRSTKIPFGDQAIFISHGYFKKIGGYREIPLMEDVELMRRIKEKGGNIHIIPLKTRSSARNWEKHGIIYTTLRNWAIQILYSAGISPDTLVKYYYKEVKQ